MNVTNKEVRKVLNNKILQLNDIIADIDGLLTKMEDEYFRVSIFGSARIKADSDLYQDVYRLAFELATRGVDIVTGGGPGLMDAANKGAKDGGIKSRSFGLHIELPFESDSNLHLDVKRHHKRFSSRLDEFMRITHAVIVMPGGVGTILELFYTWQLLQVKHIDPRPILLLGGKAMWGEFLDWIKKWPLKMELMSQEDLNHLVLCESINSAVLTLEPYIKKFQIKNIKRSEDCKEDLNT